MSIPIREKHSEKCKKQQPTDNQKNTEYRNINKCLGSQILYLACQRGGCSHPWHPSVTPLVTTESNDLAKKLSVSDRTARAKTKVNLLISYITLYLQVI